MGEDGRGESEGTGEVAEENAGMGGVGSEGENDDEKT